MSNDVIVIGGGPAGSACARLLASWGHRVLVLARPIDRVRALAESIPPSTRKLLAAIGVLEAVERAGFAPNRGNAVWWGASDGRQEGFGSEGTAGFQVVRPDLDALLAREAVAAGAQWRQGMVKSVQFEADEAVVEFEERGVRQHLRARFVVDCSGRAGVVARKGLRVYEPGHRMQAYLGIWRRHAGWPAADDRTIVETYEDGWAWSMTIRATVCQVAVMVDAVTTRTSKAGSIGGAYLAEIAKTRQLARVTSGAALDRVWACDASLYSASAFAGPHFLLAGDAGATIDPLSSYGVKKALASGWTAAVALNTALTDASRQQVAFDFFAAREREVYAADLTRTRAYARHAQAHHRHAFWAARSGNAAEDPSEPLDTRLLRQRHVVAAYERLRADSSAGLQWGPNVRFTTQPVIRGNEVVLENAVTFGGDVLRFAGGVDLTLLLELVRAGRSVPAVYEAYCVTAAPVMLPRFLAAVSLLLSQRVIETRASGVA